MGLFNTASVPKIGGDGRNLEVLHRLVLGDFPATKTSAPYPNVLLYLGSLRLEGENISTALASMLPGDFILYAIPLKLPHIVRIVRLASVPLHLWKFERNLSHAGGQLIGIYGVDPSLSEPACVYELNTAAADYADRCLRLPGSAPRFRRIIAQLVGCDPALGGVVAIGRKI